MTSAQIRKSFLDFFREKKHTIVPSSPLLPDAPNLLFTNAGMNQFVPIFLGQQKPQWNPPRVADTQKCIRAGGKHNDLEDVGLDTYHHTFFEMLGNWSFGDYFKEDAIKWAWELVVGRWELPARRLYATVYCPDEARGEWDRLLDWLCETAKTTKVKEWGSTDYQNLFFGPDAPASKIGLKENPDLEAAYWWVEVFARFGLKPSDHVVPGNKKDNFWMMGDTGPCGPCSELHVDLTPDGDTRGSLVNQNDARCIEIWNLVFIQFNANPDGSFTPLPQRHVDTGMGFERVTAIIQGTKNLTDFSGTISNYETDVFRPIFDELEKLSGKKYTSTLPERTSQRSINASPARTNPQQATDVAFRVIADHIRTLSFAIADGIIPSNEGRGYVLRRILRRAVRYGRSLGFHEPFFFKLVDVFAKTMGDVFPEVRAKQKTIQEAVRREEESFNRTLDSGMTLFEAVASFQHAIQEALQPVLATFHSDQTLHFASNHALRRIRDSIALIGDGIASREREFLEKVSVQDERALLALEARLRAQDAEVPWTISISDDEVGRLKGAAERMIKSGPALSGAAAFVLYDTYGFPLDLTELMARERGLTVDVAGFEELMEQQRERGRAAQKKETISVEGELKAAPTKFLGYDFFEAEAVVDAVLPGNKPEELNVIVNQTPFYAEMGGQVGDRGLLHVPGHDRTEVGKLRVIDTQKRGDVVVHRATLSEGRAPEPGEAVCIAVDIDRRRKVQGHHTVTHLLHWALHQLVSPDAAQKGSYVGPEKLTFDFSSAALTPQQKRDVEKMVNEKVRENAPVSWTEISYGDAKKRKDIQQFFGEKYGDRVRVVQIGGMPNELNGYSMELCGGTHVRSTSEIGAFRIVKEEAIAAGIRRIEAVSGDAAHDWAKAEAQRQQEKFEMLKRKKSDLTPPSSFDENAETAVMLETIDARAAHLEKLDVDLREWEKKQSKANEAQLQSRAAKIANELIEAHGGKSFCVAEIKDSDGKLLQAISDILKSKFHGPIFLAGGTDGRVSLVATVPKEMTAKIQANKLIQEIAPIIGGKGGGRPENAQGGGTDPSKMDEALAKAKELLSS
jgi:alanyl-tRNA synthetase